MIFSCQLDLLFCHAFYAIFGVPLILTVASIMLKGKPDNAQDHHQVAARPARAGLQFTLPALIISSEHLR